jgi:hypothetical protein
VILLHRQATSRWAAVAVALSLVMSACGPSVVPSLMGPSSSAPSASTSPAATVTAAPSSTRDDAWRTAIDTLISERERVHPNPYQGIDRATYLAAADDLAARIPNLNDEQALAGITRLAAMPGWKGREGHSGIFPFTPETGTHAYPLRFWRFSDGLTITAARAPYEALVGSQVTAIAGKPIDEVMALVEPMAPRDNPSNLLAYGPLYMRQAELLAGVGVLEHAGPAVFSVVNRDGVAHNVTVEPIPAADDVVWTNAIPMVLPRRDVMWLHDSTEPVWWRFLDDSKTLYLQYNEVVDTGSVTDDLLARVAKGGVERVVVDLRNNGGGDNHRYARLLEALQDPSIDRPGRLIVLIGRLTFSAAGNFATEVEATTGAVFVGEAMGSSPNLYGDVRRSTLPTIRLDVYIASVYWQKSTADDPRITIEPDVPIPYSSDDYFNDRDPQLEAAIRVPVGR